MDVSTDSEVDEYVTTNQPTATHDAQVKYAPALVTWQDVDGESQSLADLEFELYYDINAKRARVKLQASTRLKKGSSKPSFYLFIKPDQIETLTCLGEDEYHNDSEMEQCQYARKKLNTGAYALRFELRAPATFVVPPEIPYKFFRAGSQATWQSWRAFAKDTLRFIVHFPLRSVSKMRLVEFCQAASTSGAVKSLEDIASLYGGKGGRIIDPSVDDDNNLNGGLGLVAQGDGDAPPAYEERKTAGPSASAIAPPLCLSPNPSDTEAPRLRKRRRQNSTPEPDSGLTSEKNLSGNGRILQILCQLQRTVNESKAVHESTLSKILAKVENIENRISRLEEQQQDVVDEIATHVEPLWDEMSARLQSQEDREHDYIRDMIDEAFEEKIEEKIPEAVDQYFKSDDVGQSLVNGIVSETVREETRDFFRNRQFRGSFTLSEN